MRGGREGVRGGGGREGGSERREVASGVRKEEMREGGE